MRREGSTTLYVLRAKSNDCATNRRVYNKVCDICTFGSIVLIVPITNNTSLRSCASQEILFYVSTLTRSTILHSCLYQEVPFYTPAYTKKYRFTLLPIPRSTICALTHSTKSCFTLLLVPRTLLPTPRSTMLHSCPHQ